jgi:hypothetical protein
MHHPIHADHAHHDLDLIAGHAAGDLPDTDRASADRLLETCAPCDALRRDLVAIATATHVLPAPATSSRDFRLDPGQAERLRRGSWLRAVLRPFGATRSAVRPMAAAFTSLGIAGLFLATLLPGLGGFAGAPAAPGSIERDNLTGAQATAAPAALPAATAGPQAPGAQAPGASPIRVNANVSRTAAPDPVSSSGQVAVAGEDATGDAKDAEGGERRMGPLTTAAPPINPLILGSFALVGLGLLLFGLRIAARRLR